MAKRPTSFPVRSRASIGLVEVDCFVTLLLPVDECGPPRISSMANDIAHLWPGLLVKMVRSACLPRNCQSHRAPPAAVFQACRRTRAATPRSLETRLIWLLALLIIKSSGRGG